MIIYIYINIWIIFSDVVNLIFHWADVFGFSHRKIRVTAMHYSFMDM